MYYMYIIKSIKDSKLYIGSTNDLKRRFKEHNEGLNTSTRYRRPFILIYYEAFRSEMDARAREKNLKQFKNSYTRLKQRIKGSLEG